MPTLQLTTKTARQVWASPDGQRKIYELELDYKGSVVKAKTYSDVIATVGWSGEVESYEKTGKAGIETFVKQTPKEGGFQSSGSQKSYGGKAQADPFTMYLSYAKDIAVALIGIKAYSAERLAEIVNDVGLAGHQLYDLKDEPETKQAEPDPIVTEVPDGPVDLSKIKEVFNTDQETEEELPWKDIKGE